MKYSAVVAVILLKLNKICTSSNTNIVVFDEVHILFHFNIIPNTMECPLQKKIVILLF
jgi:hypothetical protein